VLLRGGLVDCARHSPVSELAHIVRLPAVHTAQKLKRPDEHEHKSLANTPVRLPRSGNELHGDRQCVQIRGQFRFSRICEADQTHRVLSGKTTQHVVKIYAAPVSGERMRKIRGYEQNLQGVCVRFFFRKLKQTAIASDAGRGMGDRFKNILAKTGYRGASANRLSLFPSPIRFQSSFCGR